MAILNNNSSGNFTTAATWSTIDNTSFLNTQQSTNSTTTTFVSSASFIPGAITIDGIGIQISSRNLSGGTVSVRLAIAGVPVAGTTVTININDMPVTILGWVFFKFAAPVSLVAATSYTVQMASSVNNSVSVFRDATVGNWSRFLRTTTTAAPAAADTLIVTGEYSGAGVNSTFTVTMDNTAATVFGQMSTNTKGIVSSATAASTAYKFTTNQDLLLNPDSVLEIGTSGTPIPSSSSFTLQLNQGGINVNKGIILSGNATFRSYGNSITTKAFLNADAAAAATTLTSDVATGWLSGDLIMIASTTRTSTQSETKTMTANATGTSIPISAITNAHSGTSPTKAEIGNLTRNVLITSDTASFGTYLLCSASSIVDLNFVQFRWMGSATANKRGIDVITSTGSFNLVGASLHDFQTGSFGILINQGTSANITVSNTNFYNIANSLSVNAINITASTITINDILCILGSITNNGQATTFTNITVASGTITVSNIEALTGLTINNLTAHSSSAAGIVMASATVNILNASNFTTWRNTTRGVFFSSCHNANVTGITTFGNATNGIETTSCSVLNINNITANAGVTLTQPEGFRFSGNNNQIFVNNSTFGATNTHSIGDVVIATNRISTEGFFNNCLFSSTNEIANQTFLAENSFISSTRHDQTNGVHKLWKKTVTITSDNTITFLGNLSQRLTPNSATNKLPTIDRLFSIPSNKVAILSVRVRRSVVGDGTAYNGNLPRLILKSNNSAGLTTDTVLATATGASLGNFERLVGTIPVANDNTIQSVCVDCDGTAGWINITDWDLEIINGAANTLNTNGEDYWNDGTGFTAINTLLMKNSGSENYWINGSPTRELLPMSAIDTGRYFLLFE